MKSSEMPKPLIELSMTRMTARWTVLTREGSGRATSIGFAHFLLDHKSTNLTAKIRNHLDSLPRFFAYNNESDEFAIHAFGSAIAVNLIQWGKCRLFGLRRQHGATQGRENQPIAPQEGGFDSASGSGTLEQTHPYNVYNPTMKTDCM